MPYSAMQYLCEECGCEPDDLELAHVATLQVLIDAWGLSSKEGVDALVTHNWLARKVAVAAWVDSRG